MIPTYDVAPMIDVDEAALRTLTAYKVVNGFAVVRDYEPMIDIGWNAAHECVDAEARWLSRAELAANAEAFDEILAAAPAEEAPDDFDWLFRCNDVGAAGLVFALSAAGYATYYSCRGHAGLASERGPQVGLATEPERLRLLVEYAGRASCGLETDGDGLVWVYAPSVAGLHELANLLLTDQAAFETLPKPPWYSRAMKALEHGEDFDWDDDEME